MRHLHASATALLAAFAVTGCSDTSATATDPLVEAPTGGTAAIHQGQGGITQEITDPVFEGTLEITRFTVRNGQLLASGVLNGITSTGQTVTNLRVANIPVETSQEEEGCQILHLELGPIFLDLLGLQLTTSEIIIDLTAVPGPGNLLGNLLCALVGLLDQTPLDVGLLNQLLTVINNLLGQF